MLTQEYLKTITYYNPETGEFKRLYGKQPYSDKDNYKMTTINGTRYCVHRLIFLYMTGTLPDKSLDVDHINMIRNDNRWCNLRLATRSENMRNVNTRKNNKSGYKGVYFNKLRKKFCAQATFHRVCHHLGSFDTAKEASDAYNKFTKEHHDEFYRYG
jgi:hypothetical protein